MLFTLKGKRSEDGGIVNVLVINDIFNFKTEVEQQLMEKNSSLFRSSTRRYLEHNNCKHS